MSKFVHIFPLSIYRDSLTLAPDYKQQLIDSILQMESASQKKSVDRAWLGDTAGHEFLFQREEFQELFRAIAQKIRDYTMALGMNNDLDMVEVKTKQVMSFYYFKPFIHQSC